MASRRCPVCRARFRETRLCSRCGADLTPLMLLITQAFCLRQEARTALISGDIEAAAELVSRAQSLNSTPSGQRICELVRWLRA